MKTLQNASVVFLIVILYASIFPFNSTTSASSFATNKHLRANNEEALALLKWKSSLDKQSQSLLSSWEIINPNPSNHCNSWFGISCNKAGRVNNITIRSYGLRGKLSDLNFSSLHHLTIIRLSKNSLCGTIPSEIGSLWRLTSLPYYTITIIVAAEGVLELPKISSSEDLEEAQKIISSVTTNKTLGVEILWTPQDENEILTERDVLEKYPLLRSLDTL